MALQLYWIQAVSVSNGTGSAHTPKDGIPANASIRSYSMLTNYIETGDKGLAQTYIDSYILKGFPGPSVPAPYVAQPQGVSGISEVHATYFSWNAFAVFIMITDIFY